MKAEWKPEAETADMGRAKMRVNPAYSEGWDWWVGIDAAWITGRADTREEAQKEAERAAVLIQPLIDLGYMGRTKHPDLGDPTVEGSTGGMCLVCGAHEPHCPHPWSEAKKVIALLLRVPRAKGKR